MEGATVYTTLDANRAFSKIEADRDKTAFISHHRRYRFTRITFGSVNATGTFLRTVDVILFSLKRQQTLLYLDDVSVFSETTAKYMDYVRSVLTVLRDAVVTLNIKKCDFF